MTTFTHDAQQLLALARKEADRLAHSYVGCEHLMLAATELRSGITKEALTAFGIDVQKFRSLLERAVGKGHYTEKGNIPYTPRVKRALAIANKQAASLDITEIDSLLVIIGVLRSDNPSPFPINKALIALNVSSERLEGFLYRYLLNHRKQFSQIENIIKENRGQCAFSFTLMKSPKPSGSSAYFLRTLHATPLFREMQQLGTIGPCRHDSHFPIASITQVDAKPKNQRTIRRITTESPHKRRLEKLAQPVVKNNLTLSRRHHHPRIGLRHQIDVRNTCVINGKPGHPFRNKPRFWLKRDLPIGRSAR